MHQREIDQAVARATQETLAVVQRCGFQLDQQIPDDLDPAIDWDLEETRRNVALVPDRQASSC
jgi:hypothetical protein